MQLGDGSFTIMSNEIMKYMGFAHNLLGIADPTLDLVMEGPTFIKYLAFKQARGNVWSTLKLATQQCSSILDFVASGTCPHAKQWGQGYLAQAHKWYASLKKVVIEHDEEQHARKREEATPIDLAEVWDNLDSLWASNADAYKVRRRGRASHNPPALQIPWVCIWDNLFHTTRSFLAQAQANKDNMNATIAGTFLSVGLGFTLSGRFQPPPREGAMRVLHAFGHIEGAVCVDCK